MGHISSFKTQLYLPAWESKGWTKKTHFFMSAALIGIITALYELFCHISNHMLHKYQLLNFGAWLVAEMAWEVITTPKFFQLGGWGIYLETKRQLKQGTLTWNVFLPWVSEPWVQRWMTRKLISRIKAVFTSGGTAHIPSNQVELDNPSDQTKG